MSPTNHFLQTLQHLRHYEELLLFANLHRFTEEEQREALRYLAKEYEQEAVTYPHQPPAFDEAAALWAAGTLYLAAQLLLYRENKEADLGVLLPPFANEPTPAAVLAADLALRFLPDLVRQLKVIDPDDALIPVLETHLQTWHYSAVGYPLPVNEIDFKILDGSPCLRQLYTDRVIERKALLLAQQPALCKSVDAALGLYAPQRWPSFKHEQTT